MLGSEHRAKEGSHMTEKNEVESREEHKARRRSRHGFWSGLLAGGLLGVAASGGMAALAAGHMAGGHARMGFLRNEDPETAREHLELATDWILSRVEATEDQKGQAKRVVSETFDELRPLLQEHRSAHEALVQEMTRAELDPAVIEELRKSQVKLFDRASKELAGSLTEISGILTPEQRVELVELGRRFHH
jgi:Spy/CpxP family protein refolding chaperone